MDNVRQVALITGGLSGIGLSAAIQMLERGVAVCVASTRAGTSEAKSAEASIEVAALDGQTEWLICRLDVQDIASIDRTIGAIANELGPISILVNSAGVYCHEPISRHDNEIWNTSLAINLTGPFLMTRAVWPHMIERGLFYNLK